MRSFSTACGGHPELAVRSLQTRPKRDVRPAKLALLPAIALLGFAACTSSNESLDSHVIPVTFAPVTPGDTLTQAEIDDIVATTAMTIDAPNMSITVVDRIGNILRVWNRNPASLSSDIDNKISASVARTAAYLSHSQAPLTSRTGQFISTFHFPVTFDTQHYDAPFDATATAPTRPTTGVANTGQGPLWQIDASDRGAVYGPFDAGQALPQLVNPDGTVPSPGFTPLPGGVPLYKRTQAAIASPTPIADVERRLVGGLGVYITTGPTGTGDPVPEASEFAAFSGSFAVNTAPTPAEDYTFGPIPTQGAVYLVGILLPYVNQLTRPAGFGPGANDGITVVSSGTAGSVDPIGFLISPRDNTAGAQPFTASEVNRLMLETVGAALETHAAIRLPATSPCAMVIAVTDSKGAILGLYRMNDATLFSVDIAITKARNSFYFSDPNSMDDGGPRNGVHPLAGIVPAGTAVTCRTLGFLSQPFFPPGIDANGVPGPLYALALENRKPVRADHMGFAPPAPPATDPNQSGIIFFPGSAPLYRDGVLIGGIGVSGDGVEQDDLVTTVGIRRAQAALGFQLEPPTAIRCDQFTYQGVHLPYAKFPQNPGG